MPKIRDDRKALDGFIRAHSYPAEHGLIVKKLLSHPVHARGDRGNAAAYFQFSDLKSAGSARERVASWDRSATSPARLRGDFLRPQGRRLHRDSQAEAEEVKDRLERRRLVCYASRSLAPALQRKQTLGGALSRDYYDSFDEIPGRMVYRKQI
jgi:hypothetical protein